MPVKVQVISQQPPGGRCTLYTGYADALTHHFATHADVVFSATRESHGEGSPSLLLNGAAVQPEDGAILMPADIIAALRKLSQHMAVFVIAHRLSSVSWADRLAVLAHGRIVESGPLAALMQTQDGLVRAMAAIEPFAAEDT